MCPYYLVLYMQRFHIIYCFICKVSLCSMECTVVLVLDALDQLSDEDLGREELGWSVEPNCNTRTSPRLRQHCSARTSPRLRQHCNIRTSPRL